jgi:hypothetical protein
MNLAMAQRVRADGVAIAATLIGLASMAWLGLVGFAWTDYDFEVAPAYKALAAGHLVRFLQLAPAYGGSLILRAPFALIPGLWGGGETAVYRIVALPCLLAAGGFGVWLVARMRAIGVGRLARAAALGLCVANPVTLWALEIGHPEELLGAVLCVGALLAARARRPVWAGVMLGIAVANKEWALVAVAPVLVALPAQRWRALLVSAVVAAAVLAPLALVGSTAVHAQNGGVAGTGVVFHPWQVWWFFGSSGHLLRGPNGLLTLGYRYPPSWLGSIPHALIVAIAAPLSLLWLWRRRGGQAMADDALLLLAFVLLLRCVLDPWNAEYYALPMLFALLAWETLVRRSVPVLTLASSGLLWLIFEKLPTIVSPDAQSVAYLAWALPLATGMALRLYVGQRAGRWVEGLARRLRAPIELGRATSATRLS